MANPRFNFLKPCRKCDEMFRPAGKETRVCDKCKKNGGSKRYGKK